MRTPALEYLACPSCRESLVLAAGQPESDGHVITGELRCGCGRRYPIAGGVPRLTPAHAELEQDAEGEQTAGRFGEQWKIFDHGGDHHAQQFLDWIAPLGPDDFRGQAVLEGGCGKGRHTRLVAGYGARAVVGLDLGDAVDVAFAATRSLDNAHIVQGDLTRPPVGRVFDVAFSVGVLHHLPDPAEGFAALWGRVVPGGRVAFWVYGLESNEWIVDYVDPLRKHVTSRLPETVLYWLSLPPSLVLSTALRLYRNPALARRLPYGAYLGYVSKFPAKEIHNIVFDQLVTPVAHYLSRDEVLGWLDTDRLEDVQLAWHNENSWRGCATVRDDESQRRSITSR